MSSVTAGLTVTCVLFEFIPRAMKSHNLNSVHIHIRQDGADNTGELGQVFLLCAANHEIIILENSD